MLAEFLPWLSSSISPDEPRDLFNCLCKVVPDEKLLQKAHIEEETRFNKFRSLIESMQNSGAHSSSAKFYSELCLHGDQIMDSIQKHFHNEEVEILPLARLHFTHQ